MKAEKKDMESFIKARNRVNHIKSFYAHLVLFVLGTATLLVFKAKIIDYLIAKGATGQGFLQWIEWQFVFIPMLWALILIISGIYLFRLRSNFLKKWEERQIRKYMKDEELKQ